MIYQNFDLEIISRPGSDQVSARVLESPQGDCPFMDVKWPFSPDEENELLTEIYGGLRKRRGREIGADTVQAFGGRLFEAVFSGDIEHLFRSSLDTVSRTGKGLRIRLRLPENSELQLRPWEFLFDTESREFLAVREHTPIVRYLPVAHPLQQIAVEGPLRVLVALSSPTDYPRLDIEREWDILLGALDPSIRSGQLELRRLSGRCTFDNLRDALRHFHADIFHFVGHGVPGALVLEQEAGRGLETEATQLRPVFPIGALPRLIVLNACSGALIQDMPFSGLAQGFLRMGVPAVVAMQASITDDAAMILTRYFYRDLVEIGAVDTSLTEARLRMQGNGHPIEWGTPVLYMRALDSQLFQPAGSPPAHPVMHPAFNAAFHAPFNPPEGRRPRDVPAPPEAPAPRVEPAQDENEPRKFRDAQAKQNAPPAAANQGERKKPKQARIRANAPRPLVDPEEQPAPPRGQAKKPAPAPEPGHDEPGQMAGPASPKEVRPNIFVWPAAPEAHPPEQDQPPAGPVSEPAPQLHAHPDRNELPPQAPELAPMPQPHPAGKRPAPKAQPAKKQMPPPRVEPILDEPDKAPDTAAGATIPPSRLDPRPDEPGIQAGNAQPTHEQPAPPAAGTPHDRRLLYGAAAGLLAVGVAVAVGVSLLRPGGSEQADPSTAATPTRNPSTARQAPAIQPNTRPSAPTHTDTPRLVVKTPEQTKPPSEARTKTSDSKTKASGNATRRPPVASKAAPVDDCKRAEVSERSAKCLFQKPRTTGGGQ